jgi:group I intron endonuclease
MLGRIYLVTNLLNGKQYVGQTITQHSRHGHGHALRVAYKKYGFKNFKYEVLTDCLNEKTLDSLEKFWIQVFGTLAPNGYNLEMGGRWGKYVFHAPQLGKPHTEETRLKMSESQKKHWASLDIHPNKGRKASAETKAKMSEKKKQQIQSEETRKKRSETIKLWHKQRKEQSCQLH